MVDEGTRVATVLDDPGLRAVAQVYAQAYLAAARDSGADVGEAVDDLRSLVDDVLVPNASLAASLLNGGLRKEALVGIVDRSVAPRVSPVLGNFLRVLAVHERLDLLPVVAREAGVRYEEESGRRRVLVTASHPINDGRFEHIQRSLDSALPFEPIVETRVDPELMGGIVVQVGDTVFDMSLRTRLTQLRERLVDRRVG